MPSHLYIITGASKGLGLEMALQLLSPRNQLLCISRTASSALTEAAQKAGALLESWSENLADPAPVAARLAAWLPAQSSQRWASATLINNAGTLGSMAPLQTSRKMSSPKPSQWT
jgi:NAD(P)-dependent dehydrogenase (short-subunit alcohol dehydrogenase family)